QPGKTETEIRKAMRGHRAMVVGAALRDDQKFWRQGGGHRHSPYRYYLTGQEPPTEPTVPRPTRPTSPVRPTSPFDSAGPADPLAAPGPRTGPGTNDESPNFNIPGTSNNNRQKALNSKGLFLVPKPGTSSDGLDEKLKVMDANGSLESIPKQTGGNAPPG